MTAKPKAYSYARFSTAMQASGDSLRRQTEASQKYVEDHGLDLVEYFRLTDAGVSAYRGQNATEGALGAFMEAVRSGEVPQGSYLLVESLDRLSRQRVLSAVKQLMNIIEAGVVVVTISDGQVYTEEGLNDSFSQLLIAITIMARAHEESALKGKRIGAAWEAKRRRADKEILTSKAPNWLTLAADRSHFIIDKKKAATVRWIFEQSINGKGARVIVGELNRNGVPTIGRADRWNEGSVKNLLHNRTTIGEFQPGRKAEGKRTTEGEPIKNYYPAILDEETFNLAQASIKSRLGPQSAGRKGPGLSNLFSGIAKCGYCGATMRYYHRERAGGTDRYLVCTNSQNGFGCTPKMYKYAEFETDFLRFVREADLGSLLSGAKAGTETESLRKQIVALNESISNDKAKIKDYLLKSEADPDLADIFIERMRELQVKAKADQVQLAEIESQLAKVLAGGVDVDEAELTALIAAFTPGGNGDRFRLSARIKSLVNRIDMFVVGSNTPDKSIFETDPDPAKAMVNLAAMDDRHFIVAFKNGDTRVVVPGHHGAKFDVAMGKVVEVETNAD